MFFKKLLIIIISISFFSFIPNKNNETYTLTIKVVDLRNAKGVVQFSLYNKEGTIPDEKFKKYYKKGLVEINDNSASYTFTDLPKGTYAVNILHDENKNGQIDKKFILPKEGIGFSNYQSIGLSNRPNFSKASFKLNSDKEMNIKIIYM